MDVSERSRSQSSDRTKIWIFNLAKPRLVITVRTKKQQEARYFQHGMTRGEIGQRIEQYLGQQFATRFFCSTSCCMHTIGRILSGHLPTPRHKTQKHRTTGIVYIHACLTCLQRCLQRSALSAPVPRSMCKPATPALMAATGATAHAVTTCRCRVCRAIGQAL